jgi:hypothetical protein
LVPTLACFKRAGAGTNVILGCNFRSETAHRANAHCIVVRVAAVLTNIAAFSGVEEEPTVALEPSMDDAVYG